MTCRVAALWITATALLAAGDAPDLLRFTNGDQLHGTFQGIKDGPVVSWQREDVTAPVDFKLPLVRHVVLNGGRPARALASLSNVGLVNGDRIPGKITAMDDEALLLDTSYAGSLRIPRTQISILAPSPLGGRLQYHGPFAQDGWTMKSAASPEGLPPLPRDAEGKETAEEKSDAPSRWVFSTSAWYWPGKQGGTALVRDNTLPDRAILRFDLAWKSRLSVAVGFHADFARQRPPEPAKDGEPAQPRPAAFSPGDPTIFPVLFGNSYVLQILSTHLMLFRTAVNEAGVPSVERVQINGNTVRLGEAGKAVIEIRSNRATGDISLFINDEFVVQWSEGGIAPGEDGHYAGKGTGLGFLVQTDESPVKIDDILVAEWNGMPDSARSLQVDDQDIVLLANGTDRFSGRVGAMRDGKLLLEGKYGQFQFQFDDIAEVRFARNRQAKPSEPAADEVTVNFSPLGKISGRPLSGTHRAIRLLNPICGDMNLNLESATMLDFQTSTNIADDWDVDF